MKKSYSPTAAGLVQLVQLSFRFGQTDRATFYEDGVTPESDTDHTVMVGLVACSLAAKYYPSLDIGLVAQFALVHDLVEAYVGDTPTLKISEEGQHAKEQRERAALKRIHDEMAGVFPWLPGLIIVYEERQVPEARFVKAVDKIIPKITHILNHGASLRSQSITSEEADATYANQYLSMMSYAADFPEIFDLRQELIDVMMEEIDRL